jgi:hypothetical protein
LKNEDEGFAEGFTAMYTGDQRVMNHPYVNAQYEMLHSLGVVGRA